MNNCTTQRGAIVLVGGKSRRMGTDKSSLLLEGQTFLERILTALQQSEIPIWVVAGKHSRAPKLPAGINFVRDDHSDRGPLEGLRAGLDAAGATADWLFVTSCDAPLVSTAFIAALFECCQPELDIVAPWHEERLQPLTAVYHRRVLAMVHTQIAAKQFSLQSLLRFANTCAIPADALRRVDPGLDSLRNVNSPEDYVSLLAEVTRRATPGSSSSETE